MRIRAENEKFWIEADGQLSGIFSESEAKAIVLKAMVDDEEFIDGPGITVLQLWAAPYSEFVQCDHEMEIVEKAEDGAALLDKHFSALIHAM